MHGVDPENRGHGLICTKTCQDYPKLGTRIISLPLVATFLLSPHGADIIAGASTVNGSGGSNLEVQCGVQIYSGSCEVRNANTNANELLRIRSVLSVGVSGFRFQNTVLTGKITTGAHLSGPPDATFNQGVLGSNPLRLTR